jgi:hypothetical protein
MKANLPTDEQVRQRACEIFVRNGSQPGHEVDNWLQAEYDLMQLTIRRIADLEPSQRKRGSKIMVVSLVQAAVFLGTEALLQLKR